MDSGHQCQSIESLKVSAFTRGQVVSIEVEEQDWRMGLDAVWRLPVGGSPGHSGPRRRTHNRIPLLSEADPLVHQALLPLALALCLFSLIDVLLDLRVEVLQENVGTIP